MLREKVSGSDEPKSDWSEQGGLDAPITRRRWRVAMTALTVDTRAELRGLQPLGTLGSWTFLTRSNEAMGVSEGARGESTGEAT